MDKDKMHLIPVLITDLVEKYISSHHPNEKFAMEVRLEAIRDYVDQTLNKVKEKPFFKK